MVIVVFEKNGIYMSMVVTRIMASFQMTLCSWKSNQVKLNVDWNFSKPEYNDIYNACTVCRWTEKLFWQTWDAIYDW